MAFSSDRPVVGGAPPLGIPSALNQKTRTGQEYAPDQNIPPEEALRCYTLNEAFATFEERMKGTLQAGKLADLVILGEDITGLEPARIKDIPVMAKMVGGEFCYER